MGRELVKSVHVLRRTSYKLEHNYNFQINFIMNIHYLPGAKDHCWQGIRALIYCELNYTLSATFICLVSSKWKINSKEIMHTHVATMYHKKYLYITLWWICLFVLSNCHKHHVHLEHSYEKISEEPIHFTIIKHQATLR